MQVQENAIYKLEAAFVAFNRISSELDSRYRELEAQVGRLSTELAAARSARLHELAEKERLAARLSALMDALPGGVVVLDGEEHVREENPAAVDLLGASSLGKSWQEVLRRAGIARAGYGGEAALADGRRVSVISSTPSAEQERILLLTDVSENHRLNDLLNREKRLAALGEMSARLAHQVRTPLSSALLYLSHLGREGAAGAEVQDKIRDRLRQIEGLVESMLSFIRGGIEVGGEAFSLRRLLEEAGESAGPQLAEAGGVLVLDLGQDAGLIEGKRQALFNALCNLLDNAIQACEQAPRIRLALRANAEGFEIRVEDNGRGIEPALREHIFDPFFSTRSQGTGLGLAVVASAVKAHGGDIGVEARAGGGSLFRLRLPRDPARHQADTGLWGDQHRRQSHSCS